MGAASGLWGKFLDAHGEHKSLRTDCLDYFYSERGKRFQDFFN